MTIDLTSVNGQDFTGVNAGLASGSEKAWRIDFGAAGKLWFGVQNNFNSTYGYTGIHLGGDGGTLNEGGVANGGAYCTPLLYSFGDSIGGPASNFANSNFGSRVLFKYTRPGLAAPNFDGYLGFLSSGTDGQGTDGVYGWIKATWDGTDFQFYSAAYESVAGVAIQTPSSAPVPEIDPSGLASAMSLVMGSAAMLEQRRRKRAAVAAVSAAVTA